MPPNCWRKPPIRRIRNIAEWEATAGLPDECSAAAAGDIQARRMRWWRGWQVVGRKARHFICTCCGIGPATGGNHRVLPATCNDDCKPVVLRQRQLLLAVSLRGSGDHRPANCNDDATARCSCIKAAY
ncbi:hypothetical protein J4530_08850 [Neisseria subflava]|uniref:hypothetical protein n=1 Tax=Neisseria subflava TaxID=28449 RepID=UPI002029D367|nr:hypothetical protein [Neisseria subflava]MCL9788261.1 hypothetical protein [Neisseria subflava]